MPSDSLIYIASYYNNVVQYAANNFISSLHGTVNTCAVDPGDCTGIGDLARRGQAALLALLLTPVTNGNGINHVEGMAVDTYGNVFASNAGSSGTNANTIAVYTGGSLFSNEAPLLVYPAQ